MAKKAKQAASIVAKPFRDKITKKEYHTGALYHSVDAERVAVLTQQGFLQAVSEAPDNSEESGDTQDGT